MERYLLSVTLDIMARIISAAVSIHRALGVELIEALFVGSDSSLAPHVFALKIQRWANTVEAIARVSRTRGTIFFVHVARTLSRLARTLFRQITFVG